MNNKTINMDSIINIINELQIQNKQLIDENNNLKSIFNINTQNNNMSSNIDSINRDCNNYSFISSETNLLSNNNLEDDKNSEHEILDSKQKSDQENLEKNNLIKDKFILYYYPSKNINFPPFEYKFYIQDNAKYSIKKDIKIRGKHLKVNSDSNSITASYFNNKKIEYITLDSKEFYELNPNISKNVEIFRNKNKKRFDKYDQDPDL